MGRKAFVLAFDLGAAGGRVIAGRPERGLLALHQVHRFANHPVWYNDELHWDMPRIWHEMQVAMRSLDSLGIDPVASLGVDAWGADYALLGERGVLLENPYHHRDRRTEGMMEKAIGILPASRIYDATGVQFLPVNTLYQLYAAAQNTPRLLATAELLLTIPGLLNFWLTGAASCEYTSALATQCLDQRTRLWSWEILRGLGISTHLLAPIIQPGTEMGRLRTGLAGLPPLKRASVVAPASHDTASATVAVRADGRTVLLDSGGWSSLAAEISQPVAIEDALRLNFTHECGANGIIRLRKNATGLWLLEGCRRAWESEGRPLAYPELLELAAAEQPFRHLLDGDDRLFASPDHMPCAIGAYCARSGQQAPRTPGACARAILESLALKHRMVIEQLETVARTRFEEIRIVGGGAQNELLCQFTADAAARRVLAGPAEAGALGNIAMQLVAMGILPSLEEARDLIERACPPRVYQPAPSAAWECAYRQYAALVAAAGEPRDRPSAEAAKPAPA